MNIQTRELAALAAILAVALVARIVGLNASLWYDEVLTLTRFVRLPWGDLVRDFSSLNNHMFFSLQAKAAVERLGESAWALRLPALVFGMASLPLIWWMARQAAGRGAALLTTLMLAISYHHVWFSQNARGYTGLLFWTTAATLLLANGLKRPGWSVFSAFGICLAAGMYTHLSAALFFVANGLVFAALLAMTMFAPRGHLAAAYPGVRDIRSFYGFGLGTVLTLALHAPLVTQVLTAVGKMSAGSGESTMAEWNNPLRTLSEVVASFDGLGPLAPMALFGGLVLVAVGAVMLARRAPLLASVYLTQIPVSLALLVALHFRIWPRYFFVDIGFVFLCAAMGGLAISEFVTRMLRSAEALRRLALVPTAGVVAVIAGASLVLLAPNYAHPKQDFTGAIALVEARRAPGDVAASTGLAADPIKTFFRPDWPVVETRADMERLIAAGRTVWLVTAFEAHTRKTRPDVMQLVATRFDDVAELPGTMGGGYMHVYRSRSLADVDAAQGTNLARAADPSK